MRAFLDEYPFGSNRTANSPVASDAVCQVPLTGSGAKRVAIPTGARFARVAASQEVWGLFGSSTVVAMIGEYLAAGQNAILMTEPRRIPSDATHLSLDANVPTTASVEFWS